MNRFLVFGMVMLLLDFYFFRAIKTLTDQLWVYRVYWIIDILVILAILAFIILEKSNVELSPTVRNAILAAVFLTLIPKLVGVTVLFSEDIVRIAVAGFKWCYQVFFGSRAESDFIPERRKFVSQLALGLAAISFMGMVYGVVKGKYNYQVHRVRLKLANLPKAFHGLTITQISDIHAGSFDSHEDVERGVKIINEQASDLILFTGDLVNTQAKEMNPWKDLFSSLEAPLGKLSILGNHDYGDYHEWDSQKAKQANLEAVKHMHGEIGFNLLLNQHMRIQQGNDSIVIAGVENWGKNGFQKYGDLDKALAEVENDDLVILLTHDPTHWDEKVLSHEKHVALTLSGHTHGMQMGVEIPGFRWSPSQLIYKRWAGLYEQQAKYLYVNRGFGFLGYPGRVGILPEITVITLESEES